MKQGTNFILPVNIEYDLELIEKIEFIFKQSKPGDSLKNSKTIKKFEYPSDVAVAIGEDNTINLYWNIDDTYLFDVNNLILMDTRIYLKDSEQNPETTTIKIRMNPTLFGQGD